MFLYVRIYLYGFNLVVGKYGFFLCLGRRYGVVNIVLCLLWCVKSEIIRRFILERLFWKYIEKVGSREKIRI